VVEAVALGIQSARFYAVPLVSFIPWKNMGKVAGAAILAGGILISPAWERYWGLPGIVSACLLYLAAFAVLLRLAKVPEAEFLLRRVRNSVRSILPVAEV
jgi:hypothetical protein